MASSTDNNAAAALNQTLRDNVPAPLGDKLPQIPETKEQAKAEAKAAASTGLAQLRSFAAGGFGGVCAVVVGHPFDLVKVRLQTAEKGVYSSAIDVVRKSIARDGLRRGLYAGVSAPLVGVTPMCTCMVFLIRLLLLLAQSPFFTFNYFLSLAPALTYPTRTQSPSPSGATISARPSSPTFLLLPPRAPSPSARCLRPASSPRSP